jgi:hypothetical protein
MAFTDCVWPRRRVIAVPVAVSQMMAVVSSLAVARVWPSGA